MPKFACCAAAALTAAAGIASAAPTVWTAIISNLPGDATAVLPGGLGVVDPGTGTADIDRPYLSSDGRWVLTVFRDSPSTVDDEIIVRGQGASYEAVIIESDLLPDNTLAGFFDQFLSINSSGTVAVATNTDGPTTVDETIVLIDSAGNLSIAYQEGEPIPGLPGRSWGSALRDATILDDGRTSVAANFILGSGTADDSGVFFDGAFLAREGEPIDGGPAVYENFDIGDFYVANNGTWVVQGDSDGLTTDDDFLVVNGSVVLLENQVIPGSDFLEPIDNAGIFEFRVSHAGDWIARGDNDVTDQDWVVYNGAVVARLGDQVPGGFIGEVYDDAAFAQCFFAVEANGAGDYLFGAVTDNPDILRNAVLVHSTVGVIAREGDPVDVDGDGTFDEGVFFAIFGNEDWVLTDEGVVYGVAQVKDASETLLGQVFVTIQVSAACSPADISSPASPGVPDGLLSGADFFEFLVRFQNGDLSVDFSSPSAPGQGDGLLSGADFFEFLNLFAAGC